MYPIDLGDHKRGHEQRGRRFGVMVSVTQDTWSTVTVVPTSTSAQPSSFRPELVLLGRETRLLVDQIRSIDIRYVLGDPMDYLDRTEMAQLDYTLHRYLGLTMGWN
nr:type II toxin-antitoxin system PemK/MazF family toxin [Stackebrandtia albiflava]